jgi:hypothetical protein
MRRRTDRAGIQAVEAIVIAALLIAALLVILMLLPRHRETARSVGCQRNLMKIGIALNLYDQTTGTLPGVDTVQGVPAGPSPLARMLDVLGQPDFVDFQEPDEPAKRSEDRPPLRIPGLICPSDRRATDTGFTSPVSYRVTTGDTPDGHHGPFALGWNGSMQDIEAKDGAGYTAAFSERLLGSGTAAASVENYAVAPGPLTAAKPPKAPADSWKGDAGSDWRTASWVSTLYNHAISPDSPDSRIADDRETALMGASSGHEDGVYVLFLDGSVKPFTRTVDPSVWRKHATIDDGL